MKVAIAASANTRDARVDERFGRCPFFAFYNSDTDILEFVENPGKSASGGAGPAAVQFVAKHQVDRVVAGAFGMKINDLMNGLKIQMIIPDTESTIETIIENLKK